MATGKALNGKPYAGNPHVRFDEGEVAPAATPRRGSLLYKFYGRTSEIAELRKERSKGAKMTKLQKTDVLVGGYPRSLEDVQ